MAYPAQLGALTRQAEDRAGMNSASAGLPDAEGERRLLCKALKHAAADWEMFEDTIKDLLDDDVIVIAVCHLTCVLRWRHWRSAGAGQPGPAIWSERGTGWTGRFQIDTGGGINCRF